MDKRYSEVTRMGTYNCDQKKIAKLSGLLQVTQEAGRQQMAIQRPSYEELQAKGQALMLSRRLVGGVFLRVDFRPGIGGGRENRGGLGVLFFL